MMRLTWLQARIQSFWAIGILALIAAALAVTGPQLAHLYSTAIADCAPRGNCPSALQTFLNNDSAIRSALGALMSCVPALIGMFWGAPLVAREFEAGTFRLVWTQGVTRNRWLAGKLCVVAIVSIAATGLLSLMVTWWATPLDRANMQVFASFDQRDIAPVGYAMFALVLGVTFGTALRRTLPAMVLTLVTYVAARIAMTSWVRPLFFTPSHHNLALDPDSTGYGASASGLSGLSFLVAGHKPQSALQPQTPTMPNAWIYSDRIVDESGHSLTNQVLAANCPTIGDDSGSLPSVGTGSGAGSTNNEVPAAVQQKMHDCIVKLGKTYHQLVTYQPGSRYWAFQWCELAAFVTAAVVLGALSFWAIHRKRA